MDSCLIKFLLSPQVLNDKLIETNDCYTIEGTCVLSKPQRCPGQKSSEDLGATEYKVFLFLCQSIAVPIGYARANAIYSGCFVLLPFSIAGWRQKKDIYHIGRQLHTGTDCKEIFTYSYTITKNGGIWTYLSNSIFTK